MTVVNGFSIWECLVEMRTYILVFLNQVFDFITRDFDYYLDKIPLGDLLNDLLGAIGINNLLDLLFGAIPLVLLGSLIKWGLDIFLS